MRSDFTITLNQITIKSHHLHIYRISSNKHPGRLFKNINILGREAIGTFNAGDLKLNPTSVTVIIVRRVNCQTARK